MFLVNKGLSTIKIINYNFSKEIHPTHTNLLLLRAFL